MSDDRLFDVPEVQEVQVPTLSAGQRITVRNRLALESGRHPANGLPINPEHTCGECEYFKRYSGGYYAKTYRKCRFHRLGESHSEASDMRASWPACPHWEPTS